ncbi:cyclin-A3-1-like [Salvia miltiorrhiza]|uniref:cyclin-A3-1-like n=1 Tax=Salvia miltiorrhiza TaxID=226208 RepID=UPI0025ACDCA7|nr:cyclin-A3-1-like [Salvia miltiorrhiza]
MAGEENQIQTRSKASRKRRSQAAEGNPMTKKRVVLGEITNVSSNVSGSNKTSSEGKALKLKPESVLDKSGNEVNHEIAVSQGSDEPQKYGCAPSMLQYLRSLEVEARRRPLSNYMEKVQDDINPVMRAILVDWLVEVAEEYKLVSDTLYLTVNYIDRYLSAHKLARNKLQLLGVSCMLVASKYEEISPPNIEDFCYISDNTYTKGEIAQMEREVLRFLDFELGNPTTKTFLRIFTKASEDIPMFSDLEFDFLCCYVAELSLLDYGCARYISSMVAASAIFLAKFILQPKVQWTLALQQRTGYKPYELKECVLRLHHLVLRSESSARAVRQKYSDHKFKCVSSLNPPARIPAYLFEFSSE